MNRITFITTVFNEQSTIGELLESLSRQTILPDEAILVDGGSYDSTTGIISNKIKDINKVKFKLIVKKGNRSVGRNEAIKNSSGNIIVCTDAGCILDKNWIKNITEPFNDKNVDVVAGYYKGKYENIFQKCLIPYVLVMPDKVDPNTFLPATRSLAFRKDIWGKAGKFDENLSHNEDYAFATKLKKSGASIYFEKDAIVYWIPRNDLQQAFIMFFRFAYGDAEAHIFRPKVIALFIRYFIGSLLLILAIIKQDQYIFSFIIFLLIVYLFWAVSKNFKYVKKWQAIFILPVLQLTADMAVISGTVEGILRVWDIKNKQ